MALCECCCENRKQSVVMCALLSKRHNDNERNITRGFPPRKIFHRRKMHSKCFPCHFYMYLHRYQILRKKWFKELFFLIFFFQKMRKSATESTSRLCNKHTTYKHKLSRKRRRAKRFRASNKRQVAVVCDKNDNSRHNTCVRVCLRGCTKQQKAEVARLITPRAEPTCPTYSHNILSCLYCTRAPYINIYSLWN